MLQFCGLAGVAAEDDSATDAFDGSPLPKVDSLDMWPMLSGQNLTSPRTEITFTPLKGLQPVPMGPTKSQCGHGDLLVSTQHPRRESPRATAAAAAAAPAAKDAT